MMSMRDEMKQAVEEEKKNERVKLIKNTKMYAKNVLELHKPNISKAKQEEMQKLIEEVEKPAQAKIARIRYERNNDSVLNEGNPRSLNGRIKKVKKETRDEKYLSALSSISKVDDSLGHTDRMLKQDILDSDSQYEGEGLDSVPTNVAKYESALNPHRYINKNRSEGL